MRSAGPAAGRGEPRPWADGTSPRGRSTRPGERAPPREAADGATARDAGSGDERLAEWMQLHETELRRHLSRMLAQPDDADDVLQEVWMTAHESPPGEGGDGSVNVRAWLYRVATHAALDRLALERRRTCLLECRAGDVAPDPAPQPDAELLGEVSRERIRTAVVSLPRKQREAVWLRWIEGEDYGTVAEKLESTEAAARANVYQGLKQLREELADLWNEGRGR